MFTEDKIKRKIRSSVFSSRTLVHVPLWKPLVWVTVLLKFKSKERKLHSPLCLVNWEIGVLRSMDCLCKLSLLLKTEIEECVFQDEGKQQRVAQLAGKARTPFFLVKSCSLSNLSAQDLKKVLWEN